jgi:1-acyl-sn-glycerol-3-phosphate acyltransferase
MATRTYRLKYPRKRFNRFVVHLIGRLILPILFKIKINGRENFPRRGPLLVVGNHTAAMEAVLLIIFSPWQIEMLSAADTPAEMIVEFFENFYGAIPLHRGSYDRAALDSALDILKQDGIVGLFPEGGIWEVGKKKAQTGIAWLSYRSGAPILPIGFNDTTGAINQGLRLKRPTLTMDIGQIIQPAQIPKGIPRKEYFQIYADQVMEEVHKLIPEEDYHAEPEIIDEEFDLEINVFDPSGKKIQIPEDLIIQHDLQLAKFLHRPALLKIFFVNLDLPAEPLQNLSSSPDLPSLILATKSVLEYLEKDNPYLLTYRFGIKGGLEMQESLDELLTLLEWCNASGYLINIQPIRTYYSVLEQKKITQLEQGSFQSWM